MLVRNSSLVDFLTVYGNSLGSANIYFVEQVKKREDLLFAVAKVLAPALKNKT